eukprot:4605417-Pleurochrysis_carterae.AAC.1
MPRTVSSAAGVLLRSGYAPSPRWKCWRRSSSLLRGSEREASEDEGATLSGAVRGGTSSMRRVGSGSSSDDAVEGVIGGLCAFSAIRAATALAM